MSDDSSNGKLSHIKEDGSASMVDVSQKPVTERTALATGKVYMAPDTLGAILEGTLPKGDVIAVARIAGIQAAKRTAELIPLCHQLPLSKVELTFEPSSEGDHLSIGCRSKTIAQTGVEMEALTGVSVAALTIYDMCKAIDKEMVISDVTLVEKTK